MIDSRNYGYIVIEFKDAGPELIAYENIPLKEEHIHAKAVGLGIYLSLVVGQGKGIGQSGLYGPLPWSELPGYLFLVLAFYMHDPFVKDPRAKKTGCMTYAGIMVPRNEIQLLHARLALEQSLSQIFIHENDKPYELANNEPLFILSLMKIIIWKTIAEGDKILQEKALEELMDNAMIDSITFIEYDESGKYSDIILIPIKGELELKDDMKALIRFNHELVITPITHNVKIGLFRFQFIDKIALIKLINIGNEQDFISVYSSITKSLPLIEEYFF